MAQLFEVLLDIDDRDLQRTLDRLEQRLSPPGLALWLDKATDPWIRERARKRFEQEGDDVSGPWLPLGEFTQNVRAQQGYGAEHPINVRTGEMERYITGPGDVTQTPALTILEAPGGSPTGELADKIRTAQDGSTVDNRYTPPRPVLGINARDVEAIMVSLAAWVNV